jgi:hypothetical protein
MPEKDVFFAESGLKAFVSEIYYEMNSFLCRGIGTRTQKAARPSLAFPEKL